MRWFPMNMQMHAAHPTAKAAIIDLRRSRRDWKQVKFIRALTSLPGTRARYGGTVNCPSSTAYTEVLRTRKATCQASKGLKALF